MFQYVKPGPLSLALKEQARGMSDRNQPPIRGLASRKDQDETNTEM